MFKMINFELSWYSRKSWPNTIVYTIQEPNEPTGCKSVSITTLFGDRSGRSWRGNKWNQKIINCFGFWTITKSNAFEGLKQPIAAVFI